MEKINEILKKCTICCHNLPLINFRPKRRMCKQCVFKREQEPRKQLMRAYYYAHRDDLLNYKKSYWIEKNKDVIKQKRGPKKKNEIVVAEL